jgi:hypothetical protein
MIVFGRRWGAPQQQDEWNGGKRKDHHQLAFIPLAVIKPNCIVYIIQI